VSNFVARTASDFFGYVILFQSAPETQRPAPAALRNHLISLLERFRQDAQAQKIPDAEIEHARFALVAWADEMILAHKWAGLDEWQRQPLQQVLFNTVRAGNQFYERVHQIRAGEDQALEIFFFCLALGFQGELVTEPERRNALVAKMYETLYTHRRVIPALERGELSAPAYSWQFTDQQPGGRRITPIVAWMILGVGVCYALCWAALRYAASDMVPLAGFFS